MRCLPSLPMWWRRSGSSSRSEIARAKLVTSFGLAYTAESPAETRVSFRSKATTGSSNAMYSIVLFIVETSFSGFRGSGHRPRSAVDRISNTTSSGTRPVNSTLIGNTELSREIDQLLRTVALAHQHELDVVSSHASKLGNGTKSEIHAVLRPHDAEIGAQIRPSPPPRRDRAPFGRDGRGRARCGRR